MDADGFQERETILARLGYIKKTVNALGRMLKQKQRIGLELISRQIRVIKPNIQISLHDVVDRLTLAKDRLDEAASSLDYINQNFLIKLQVRRMHSITYKREMMKTVTYISAFTIPADVMIQYMSLSFKTPGRGESKSILWWFVSLISIFAISFAILLWVMREFNRLVPKGKKQNTNRSLRAWWPAGLPGFKKQNSIIKSS
jgi:Mg2+ and Co2+ transporter CorA